MEPIEIIAIVVCAVIVVGVLVSALIRRAKGKTGCDCGDCCGGCAGCGKKSDKRRIK